MYHVLFTGNERGSIVFDAQNRKIFADCIEQMAARFEIDILSIGGRFQIDENPDRPFQL